MQHLIKLLTEVFLIKDSASSFLYICTCILTLKRRNITFGFKMLLCGFQLGFCYVLQIETTAYL